jgi:hypothetical protein
MSKILDHVEQPDAVTCQSAAIAKVLGMGSNQNIHAIRSDLLAIARRRGTKAGDPAVMAEYLAPRVEEYRYSGNGSVQDVINWVTKGPGYEVIIHGFTTISGHIWGIEDVVEDTHTRLFFKVDDPWYEFDFPNNRYTQRTGKNVHYSGLAIWAYCVIAWNNAQAVDAYQRGSMSRTEKGAWIHFIKN